MCQPGFMAAGWCGTDPSKKTKLSAAVAMAQSRLAGYEMKDADDPLGSRYRGISTGLFGGCQDG